MKGYKDMNTVMIDYKMYKVLNLIIDEVEGEAIAYNDEKEIIVVLNKTALKIWNQVIEYSRKSEQITLSKICEDIINVYNISEKEHDSVYADINNLFLDFVNKGLLIENNL